MMPQTSPRARLLEEEFWVNMFRVIVLSSVIGRRVIKMNALHGIRVKLTWLLTFSGYFAD